MKCVICDKHTDGLPLCRDCMQRSAKGPQEQMRIRQTANILMIAEGGMEGLKHGIESILEVGDSLEVFAHGKEQKKT